MARMTFSGKKGRKAPPQRAARAARTPKPGSDGGPFAHTKPERLISAEPKPVKIRADEAEANFRSVHQEDGTRLQKILAQAGVASRRVCEDLIAEGRVTVEGKVIVEPGVRVNPDTVTIHVDGVRVTLDVTHRYVMFNKPAKVMTTMRDPEGRRCVGDYLDESMREARLVHVGRLDYETEGLLLLTNDGDLTNKLTHPRYEVPKTYMVEVQGELPVKTAKLLQAGIELNDGPIAADRCWVIGSTGSRTMVEVTLHSGRNRIVRRMFEHIGFPVTRLVRTAIGKIVIGDQPQGALRDLEKQEIGHLQDLAGGVENG
jgi:23S rRNA pseudouridine2605 synthase